MVTSVYTDGACSGNPGPGGWAWAVPGGRWATGFAPATTNQRMELTAALEAARANPGRIDVVSDSLYVVKCFEDRWYDKWLAQGWKNSAKKPVANRDLWQPLIELYLERANEIGFRWVKGHSDDAMNDLVDKLAVRAGQLQQGETGEGVPDVSVEQLDPRIPPGHRVALIARLGTEPPPKLADVLRAKKELHDDLVVLTGMESFAAAAESVGVPATVVLAYPPTRPIAGAVVLQGTQPPSRKAAGVALSRRDAWLARAAHEAVAVWDGDDAVIGKQVRAFQDRVGEENVWVLEP